jgi:two-component system, chemotaxis family, CheB/CheR fusion protein
MDNRLQDRVIPIFHYALVLKGILVLGSSETITHHERLFEPLGRSHRIFVRREGPARFRAFILFRLVHPELGRG